MFIFKKDLIFCLINISASISLIGLIIYSIVQIILNITIGDKVKLLSDNIQTEVIETVSTVTSFNIQDYGFKANDMLYGDNAVLLSMFVITILIGLGYILKGGLNIMTHFC